MTQKIISIARNCVSILLLVGVCACSSVQVLKQENFTSDRGRTFENTVSTDLASRRAELNIEVEKTADGPNKFNLLFSLHFIPVLHDALELSPGGKINFTADGEKISFASQSGSKEDISPAPNVVGKLETIRFENISTDSLQKITAASTVLYEIGGEKVKSAGRLSIENLKVLAEFYKKYSQQK